MSLRFIPMSRAVRTVSSWAAAYRQRRVGERGEGRLLTYPLSHLVGHLVGHTTHLTTPQVVKTVYLKGIQEA